MLLVSAGAAIAGRWVIPPGQEAIVGRMLGGALPGGCRFAGASIEKTQVSARYACADGERRIALRHPSEALDAAVRSKQLAVVVPAGSALPQELVAALGDRLRAEDATWRWLAEGRSLGRTIEEAGLPPRARRLVLPLGAAAAIAFAATFGVALALARRIAGTRAREEAGTGEWRSDLRAAVIVTVVALLFLKLTYAPAPVHPDTTRDLLMATDCRAGLPCDHGPPTTLGVIVQGALWTRWLALGMSIGALQAATYLLFAVSAAVVLVSTRRRFGTKQGWFAATFYVIGAAALLDVPILWNPSLAPLPLAIFHALMVALAWDREGDEKAARSIGIAAGAAFALALAIDCHVLFAVLVPALFAVLAGCSRRPLAATMVAAFVLVGTLIVDSRTAWTVNARAFVDAGAALPLLAMVVLAAVAAAIARPRILALPPRARALVFVGAATIYTTGATIALFAVLGPAAGRRYLVPAVPGLALAAAAIVAMLARAVATRMRASAAMETAIGAAITVAIVAGGRRVQAPSAGDWAITDVEAIAGEVYRRAPSYRDVLGRVRARAPGVIQALGIFEPRDAKPGGDPREETSIFVMPKAIAPRGNPRLNVMDLGPRAAVIATLQPFLDRTRTTFCFTPRTGTSDELGCADGSLSRTPAGPETPEERAYPSLTAVRDAFPPELLQRSGGVRQTITVAVKTSPGAAHRVVLFAEGSGYRIEKVTGVKRHGELPAREVVIEGGEGAGEIVIGREDGGEPRNDRYWMPIVMEIPDDDADLRRLVTDDRVR
ncbi:MAG: hypothetical protein QM820_30855 [Minicystis sp.]